LAYFSLQLRRNYPDTASGLPAWSSRASSPGLGDHRTQPEQISQPTVGSPTREGDERIGLGDIGPIDGHGGQGSAVIGVKDAVLTPGVVDGHDVERPPNQWVERMGDAEDSMRIMRIDRS
jgi:hypothetical protein